MPILVDAGLFLILAAGALFLGSVGMALYKELKKGDTKNETDKPSDPK